MFLQKFHGPAIIVMALGVGTLPACSSDDPTLPPRGEALCALERYIDDLRGLHDELDYELDDDQVAYAMASALQQMRYFVENYTSLEMRDEAELEAAIKEVAVVVRSAFEVVRSASEIDWLDTSEILYDLDPNADWERIQQSVLEIIEEVLEDENLPAVVASLMTDRRLTTNSYEASSIIYDEIQNCRR